MFCRPVGRKTTSTMCLGLEPAALKSSALICIHYAWWVGLLGVYDKWREYHNNTLSICARAISAHTVCSTKPVTGGANPAL